MHGDKRVLSGWRFRLHEIIFEADTRGGKAFDVLLLWAILASVTAVVLESVTDIQAQHGGTLRRIEWIFTILFTIEYILRLLCIGRPWRYATSFFGVVDVLAIAPTYLGLLFTGTAPLLVIRILRLLRVFRVLKLVQFVGEANLLMAAFRASVRKVVVFLGTVLIMTLILGTAMYLIEGEENGFTNIPQSVYWAIVTMTTVGYGDIAPNTVPGRILASAVMILGFSIIAVPTGIVTAEIAGAMRGEVSTQACPDCSAEGHDPDAKHCKFCGAVL